ncbi:MAG: hypothetical protein IPI34_09560 [bacterium]|nr:hypothetical protein [bacterium]
MWKATVTKHVLGAEGGSEATGLGRAVEAATGLTGVETRLTTSASERTDKPLAVSIHSCSVAGVAARQRSQACDQFKSPFSTPAATLGSSGNRRASTRKLSH